MVDPRRHGPHRSPDLAPLTGARGRLIIPFCRLDTLPLRDLDNEAASPRGGFADDAPRKIGGTIKPPESAEGTRSRVRVRVRFRIGARANQAPRSRAEATPLRLREWSRGSHPV